MHNLPAPPLSLITHQLDCIRCNHKFPVAEDSPKRKSSGLRSHDWQALPHVHPDEHRRVLYPGMNPTAHRELHKIESEPGHDKHYLSSTNIPSEDASLIKETFFTEHRLKYLTYPLYCPRCGADNRNWLYLKTQSKWAVWQQARIYQFIGLFIICIFLSMFVSTIKVAAGSNGRTAVFVIVLCLAGILPLIIVPNQWKPLRDYKYFRRIVPNHTVYDSISSPVGTLLGLGLIFVIAIPFFLYIILPVSGETFDYKTPQQAVVMINELAEQLPRYVEDANVTQLGIMIDTFKDVEEELDVGNGYLPPLPETARNQTADWMLAILHRTRLEVDRMDQTQLNNVINNLSVLDNMVQGIPSFNFSKMINFLIIWVKYVGFISFVCSILAWLALNHVAESYDAHVPRPIYHSMSDMTRVSRWEANKVLKAREITRRAQWTDVRRNSNGGVVLTGVLRDMPENPDEDKVRAQQFVVNTDRWCHIVDAHITDILAPIPPVGNSFEHQVVYKSGRKRQTHLRISG